MQMGGIETQPYPVITVRAKKEMKADEPIGKPGERKHTPS